MTPEQRVADTSVSYLDEALIHLFSAMPDPVFLVAADGTVRFVNERFAAFLGCDSSSVVNQSFGPWLDPERNVEFSRALAELATSKSTTDAGIRVIVAIDPMSGPELAVELSLTPLVSRGQRFYVCIGRELSPTHNGQRPDAVEQRLIEAQRIARIGNWEWDILNSRDWWSDELYRIMEVDPEKEQPSFEFFQQFIHPDDLDRLKRETQDTLVTDKPFAADMRVVLRSGRQKHVRTQGIVHRDADGHPIRMTGTLQDVTDQVAAEAALRRTESRYRDAQRIAKIGNFEWDIVRGAEWWSHELYQILGATPDQLEAKFENFLDHLHPDDRERALANKSSRAVRRTDSEPQTYRLLLPDGTEKVIEMLVEMRHDDGGNAVIASGTVHDVTERHLLERQLRESEARYSSTVELAAIGIAHVAPDGRFIWANQQLCDLLGWNRAEITDLTIADISHPDDLDSSTRERARLHQGELDSAVIEKRYVRKDDTVIWVRITSAVRRDDNGEPVYDISVIEDISDRKAVEKRIQYLATHDEMTGLPNRATITELVGHAIDTARRHGRQCALLFIDLDRFKIVNDSLGHDAGDLLLTEMAERIGTCVESPGVLARFGGDEFVVLLEDLGARDDVVRVAREILSTVIQPLKILGQECRVTASIGIAMYPEHARDARALMRHADSAMYFAKDEGKNNFQFYSPEASPLSVENLVLESQLSHALEREEFTIHYQARIDVDSGRLMGAESLLRWWNHNLGTVAPSQFIQLAEDNGLIVEIGRWVLRRACQQSVEWQRRGLAPIVMSVNLSPRQFKDPDLLNDIADALESTGLAPELLELEITESMITHVQQAAERLREIKRLGVRLAIDDFGTGYSSLSQLKKFPIDTLKVDRSFVRDIPGNPEDEAITEAVISLGKTLKVTVIAEGVETEVQHAFLREHGCDQMQGYLFHQPCSPESFAQFMRGQTGRS